MSKPELDAIFDADRALRRGERELLRQPRDAVQQALAAAVAEARSLSDRREAVMRLERLADLCAQVPGPEMTDALIAILDDEAASVRVQAADALVDVAFERYAEVARGVERAIERGEAIVALRELPWVIAEVGEPSARPLIVRFLGFDDAEIVASAIEALAALADPAAIKDLEKLVDDQRTVELEDEETDDVEGATIGELAQEAIDALSSED